jgi:hypothetical protein
VGKNFAVTVVWEHILLWTDSKSASLAILVSSKLRTEEPLVMNVNEVNLVVILGNQLVPIVWLVITPM